MKVFQSKQNVEDLQVENGLMFLLFDVKKSKGYDNLAAFFGDLVLSTSDTLKVLYTSRSGGQRTIIPSLPVLPVAIAATMGPQHIQAHEDAQGKINRVVFPVLIGVGGALTLNNNSYISVSTSFSDLADEEGSLKIFAIDTTKSDFLMMYESIHLNASSMKEVDLSNCNQLITSKQLNDFQLIHAQDSYSVNWSEKELESVARAQNDLLSYRGKDVTAKRNIQGQQVDVNLGFLGNTVTSGGTFYNAIGVSDFKTAKITSVYDDRCYCLRVVKADEV